MNIHEELHRLVLRHRWMRWALRYGKQNGFRPHLTYFLRLSRRLTRHKPIWSERNDLGLAVDAESGAG